MLSFTARLLIAASVVLIGFLSLTGLALDRAFQDNALSSVRERLQTQVHMLLGAADLDADNKLTMPRALPEVRLSIPDSGLYATVVDSDGRSLWRSASMLGISLGTLPKPPAPGTTFFDRWRDATGADLFMLGFAVVWELSPDSQVSYAFWIAEDPETYDAQVNKFRRNLWIWLPMGALVLLAVQGVILRWSLRPLRRVAHEIREIETGQRGELSGGYPRELLPLTDNLNVLVRQSRSHLERYRNALGDLAHSLKTPLAVLNSSISSPANDELRQTVANQVERMNQTVDYQLQRAAAAGRVALAAPLDVATSTGKVIDSLTKVYADKNLHFSADIDPTIRFYGERGDLLEILGNLLDNASKWAKHEIKISAQQSALKKGRNPDVLLSVEDDGPGIPAAQREQILARGHRADPNTPGHGIGLAIVRDLVEEVYRGELTIDTSPLGGARIQLQLRF